MLWEVKKGNYLPSQGFACAAPQMTRLGRQNAFFIYHLSTTRQCKGLYLRQTIKRTQDTFKWNV